MDALTDMKADKLAEQVAKLQEQVTAMQAELDAVKASARPVKRTIVPGGTVLNKAQIIDGPIIFVSGQTGYSGEAGGLAPGGLVPEAKQALSNLGDALTAAGSDFSRCLKVNIYLTTMADYAAFNEVYMEVFPDAATRPARTCVAVAELPIG